MTLAQRFIKRTFDISISLVGLLLTWWIIMIAFMIATIETKSNGFFTQKRVGRYGKFFTLIKIKTMIPTNDHTTTITTSNDPRITKSGAFFRRTKIDELPQLLNVLAGSMSLVGPRPDVSGYADTLQGENSYILTLRPGITGPATLKYKDEETLLSHQENPKHYNDTIIWPDKIYINGEYLRNWTLWSDVIYLWRTIVS